ncbi:MAG: site-specific integrase, partial [Methylophaga sp.]|nr:site-specific integrase [Methylophaga sp.]
MGSTAELQTTLQRFIDYLAQQRRVSIHTVNNYQRDCLQLLAFCDQQKISSWQAIKPADLR